MAKKDWKVKIKNQGKLTPEGWVEPDPPEAPNPGQLNLMEKDIRDQIKAILAAEGKPIAYGQIIKMVELAGTDLTWIEDIYLLVQQVDEELNPKDFEVVEVVEVDTGTVTASKTGN